MLKITVKVPKLSVPVACPKCSRKHQITAEVEARGELRCSCGARITFKGRGLGEFQKALNDLSRLGT